MSVMSKLGTLARGVLVVCTAAACAGTYPTSTTPVRPGTGATTSTDRGEARSDTRPAVPTRQETQRYGFWIGAIDTLAVTVFLGGVAAQRDGGRDTSGADLTMFAGIIGYWLASPLVHTRYNKAKAGGGSFLMRVTLPIAGMVAAESLSNCDPFEGSSRCESAAPIGLAVGAIVTTLADSLFLAKRRRAVPVSGASRVTVQPVIRSRDDGHFVGLAGRF